MRHFLRELQANRRRTYTPGTARHHHSVCDPKVLNRQARRIEERDRIYLGAAGSNACEDCTQLVYSVALHDARAHAV